MRLTGRVEAVGRRRSGCSPDGQARIVGHTVKLWAMIRSGDVTFGFHLFSEVIGITDNLLDLLNYPPRLQNTTDDTVNEGDQSHDTDDRTHEIVQRK